MSTPRRSLFRTALALTTLALLAGCAATEGGDAASDGEVVNADDALTADEAAAGASWSGEEEDAFTPEEEAALASSGDPTNEAGAAAGDGDVQTSSLRFQSGGDCTQTTGYNKGRAMRICVTTVNGKEVEVNTASAYARMRDAAARDGVSLTIVSGFRTMQKQRELYAAYKAHRGNLAAPPGYSNHQSGHALDLNAKAPGVYAWLTRNGAKFGFRRTVPSEIWHWEKW